MYRGVDINKNNCQDNMIPHEIHTLIDSRPELEF